MTTEVQLTDAVNGGEISGTEVASAHHPTVRSSVLARLRLLLTQCDFFMPIYDIILIQQGVIWTGQSTPRTERAIDAGRGGPDRP